ncbi:hypothetical protein WME94_20160 [Sorangium sp. So ce429]
MKRYEITLNESIPQRATSALSVGFSEHVRQSRFGDQELCLRVTWPNDKQIDLPNAIDTSGGPTENRIWILVNGDETRLITMGGLVAYWLTDAGNICNQTNLHREPSDEEFWDIQFLDNRGEQIVIYEGGVLLIDTHMDVRWHIKKRYNDYFDGVDADALHFVCEDESWKLMVDTGAIIR